MNDKKYNGWTNYATWRVNLEILDGFDSYDSPEVEPEYLKDYVEEFILMDVDDTSLVASYAMAFISEVNWHEIAEHINEEQKERGIIKGDLVMCKRECSPNYNKAGVVMSVYVENTRQRHELAIVRYADGTDETTPIWRLSLMPDGDEQ